MAFWPYRFLDLDAAQKHARRETLDHYAAVAHGSTLLPVFAAALYRLVLWAMKGRTSPSPSGNSSSRGAYVAVPGSPALKHQNSNGGSGTVGSTRAWLRKTSWWLGDDVVLLGRSWGQRDQYVFGAGWSLWLLVLCFVGTGDDYLHLTKRLGIVAITQFPLQYALSLKQLNPVAWAFHSSHERVNRIHRVLGRIVYALLCAHAALYLNFYYQTGVLGWDKLSRPVPALGLLSIVGMTLLMSTSLGWVRSWSYRVFFVMHLAVGLGLPVAVFFHAHSAKILVVESLVVILADIGVRRLSTVDVDTRITRVGDKNSRLVKMDMALPSDKLFNRFASRGEFGAHVYLNVPHASRPKPGNLVHPANLQFELMFNPFSIAAADDKTRSITLVAKRNKGPMTGNLDRLAAADDGQAGGRVSLGIQGPFGCSQKFPDFSSGGEFSSVFLVAGGVGATFILPIYRALIAEKKAAATATAASGERESTSTGHQQPRVKMIWTVRTAAEATWATTMDDNLLSDDSLELYLTEDIGSTSATTAHNGRADGPLQQSDDSASAFDSESGDDHEGIPLTTLPAAGLRGADSIRGAANRRRPDLAKIVDDVFKHPASSSPHDGRKVAVLVCGPAGMARELRGHVGTWVTGKGRDVWWHDEGFSW
ncbi:ferric reductase NAD binding domain-domain-containing protein [Microdochium bolleyi]|uniref:Ferric reductase NAD binding domain-domain-containing protein n=1 Tax=Microdochium bolleyi TaxID=196109 RepID=A0A136IWQ4_9PEZI|nr:ferric reductase NAD binding domain-domain-containing protein [Microdochium bolleyi]